MAGRTTEMHGLKAEGMTGRMKDMMTGVVVKHAIVIMTGVETETSGSGMTNTKR